MMVASASTSSGSRLAPVGHDAGQHEGVSFNLPQKEDGTVPSDRGDDRMEDAPHVRLPDIVNQYRQPITPIDGTAAANQRPCDIGRIRSRVDKLTKSRLSLGGDHQDADVLGHACSSSLYLELGSMEFR